jgi:hypothetical protein
MRLEPRPGGVSAVENSRLVAFCARMKASRRGGSFGGFLLMLLVGGVIGAGICYYVLQRRADRSDAVVEKSPSAAPAPTDENTIERKLREWHLTPEEVKRELASAGKVVREKGSAIGQKVAGATSDVTIIAKIKTKFALDNRLQALKISVGCKEGRVTLTGTVASSDLIGRAVVLALDTEGVVDVASSLKVE